MEAIAKRPNCPGAPRKMRLVADNIRGLNIEKALGILKYQRTVAATHIAKVLRAAIANWEVLNRADASSSSLYVKSVFIDQGPMLKRVQPAPQGRAHRIRKRYSHINVVVDSRMPVETKLSEEQTTV